MASDSNTCHDEPMDCQDEDLVKSSSNKVDKRFDITIGHIEDIIMEDAFQSLQQEFLEKNYLEFEDKEENKLSYTDIHQQYTYLIEKFLYNELTRRIPEFSMKEFSKQLVSRKSELEGEIFEILLTFTDFMTFKEMFIDYRNEKEGRNIDLSDGITVTPISDCCITSSNSISESTSSGICIDGSALSISGQSMVSQ